MMMRRLKGHKTLAIGLTLLLVLAACSKEARPVLPEKSSTPIVFDNPMPETKGAPQLLSLERLAAQDFSVNAWYTPDGETFGAESISYIRNHRFGTLSEGPDYSTATWQGITRTGGKAASPVYYPIDGTLSYYCFAPYRENVSETSDVQFIYEPETTITDQLSFYIPHSPLICFTPSASPATQIDFIAASPILDVHRNAGAIPLDFTHHLTTDIQFWFKYAGTVDPSEGIVISQIIIRDVIGSEYLYFTEDAGVLGFQWCNTISPVDGSATMPTASYTLEATTADLIIENPFLEEATPKHVNNTINGRLFLLPQSLPAGAQLEITYQLKNRTSGASLDENVVTCSLDGTSAWPMGKTVKYTVTLGVPARKIISITTEIIPWANAGNTHSEQELMY